MPDGSGEHAWDEERLGLIHHFHGQFWSEGITTGSGRGQKRGTRPAQRAFAPAWMKEATNRHDLRRESKQIVALAVLEAEQRWDRSKGRLSTLAAFYCCAALNEWLSSLYQRHEIPVEQFWDSAQLVHQDEQSARVRGDDRDDLSDVLDALTTSAERELGDTPSILLMKPPAHEEPTALSDADGVCTETGADAPEVEASSSASGRLPKTDTHRASSDERSERGTGSAGPQEERLSLGYAYFATHEPRGVTRPKVSGPLVSQLRARNHDYVCHAAADEIEEFHRQLEESRHLVKLLYSENRKLRAENRALREDGAMKILMQVRNRVNNKRLNLPPEQRRELEAIYKARQRKRARERDEDE
jgi:hypothetical protein